MTDQIDPRTQRHYGPNVELIRAQASRVIKGRIPAEVRRELMDAVKKNHLGRLAKDGLKPEIFFHPDHLHGARERQVREATYSINCIATVMHKPTNEEVVAKYLAAHADGE